MPEQGQNPAPAPGSIPNNRRSKGGNVFAITPIKQSDFVDLYTLFQEFAAFSGESELLTNSPEAMVREADLITGLIVRETRLYSVRPPFPKKAPCQAEPTEGRAVAYISWAFMYNTWHGKTLYIDDLYVIGEFRRQGLGKTLSIRAFEYAKANGCHSVRWLVKRSNIKAIAFYRTLGVSIDTERCICLKIL